MLEVVKAKTSAASDQLVRQTLEMDADSYGTTMSVGRIFVEPRPFTATTGGFFTPQRLLGVWCFSMTALFHLWDLTIFPDDLMANYYPPPAIRFSMAVGTVAELLRQKFPEFHDNFSQIANAAVADYFHAAQMIQNRDLSAERAAFVRAMNDPRMTDHIASIKRCWDAIRPELLKHSFTHHLAP